LSGLALPSFAAEDGIWVLGWLAMVPLFLVFSATGFWGGVFYGVVYGLFRLVLTNFWLATFSLVSLQFAVLVFLFFYGLFFPILMVFYHGAPRFRLVILPLAWTLFEYLRSSGFLGYPWALTAPSQYSVLPIIQISAVTGVWGVSFLVILVNAAFAHALVRRLDRPHLGGAPAGGLQSPLGTVGATAVGLALLAYAGSVAMAFGSAYDHNRPSRAERGESREAAEAEEAEAEEAGPSDLRTERTPAPQVRVALIQQNSDPRKHEYTRTLNSLRGLTDEALRENPDIVIWSETAFVPNIRRWGAEEPTSSRYARLVDRFLTYQSSINTWLVTGNDDYELVTDEEGREIDRLNYNAAVLFDDDGNRVDTYRKIKLVPFTEYFPYQESLPWVYQLLLEFDTHFWEPGVDRTVFEHPKFTFSTPICFEDVFPNEVRLFVLAGAEVIANMSNDYWSLTPVQAKQHFVAGIFRAVENRRPVVRATASGTTGHVDRFGRIKATVPTYSEEYLVADVTIPPDRFTIYTRWGDWFPLASGVVLILLLMVSLMRPGVTGRRNG
ncbi:MAG: apolipoprotein N-acyltransferase, partial [Spirochaetota bacterium]